MKILVIFTGGTIGSCISEGRISPCESTKKELISRYCEKYGNEIEFDSKEPYTILSENLSASELNKLIKTVREEIGKDYDGIIVTHGTDTLQYSAAALSFALGNETVPVMLVSANYPLSDEKSNGLINFTAAVEFIKAKCGKGVFVPYRNADGKVYIHRGLSLLTHPEADDTLLSFGVGHFAVYSENGIELCGCNEKSICPRDFELVDEPGILVINAVPADSFSYDLSGCNAVILRPYHSGTLNTANGNFRIFCLKAKSNGIPVYTVNAVDGTTYESSSEFRKLSITPLYNSAFIESYIRIWIEISNKK